jgi:hypothetical protein
MNTRKNTRPVSSNLEAEPSSPHSSPPRSSPLQAGPDCQLPGSSSPERTQSLRSKPISSPNDPYIGSNVGLAGIDVQSGPLSTPLSSQRREDGRSKSAPIDVDGPEISVVTNMPSSSTRQRPVSAIPLANGLSAYRIARSVRGSSDEEEREANFDLPTPKPRPRGRLVGRDAAADRHLESNKPVSLLTEQNQGRDSSIE